jgi:DNA repair exonuclease SbcCD ATPase subunit
MEIAQREDIGGVILGGDLFREYTPATVEFISDFVRSLRYLDLEVILLVGNHDREIGTDKLTATFEGWDLLIHIVEKPAILGNLALLPAPDRAAFGATREAEGPKKRDAALSDALDASLKYLIQLTTSQKNSALIYHASLDAALFGGKKIASGMTWTVPATEVARWGMGIGFHIHSPEDYPAERFGTEIHTIGAPVPDTFGVSGETFRVGILEVGDHAPRFESVDLPRVVQRIEIDISRDGERIVIAAGEYFIPDISNPAEPLALCLSETCDISIGDRIILKINASLPEADLAMLPPEDDIRVGLEAEGLNVSGLILRRIPVNMVKSRLDEAAKGRGLSPGELLRKWADVSEYEDTKTLEIAASLLDGEEAFEDWNSAGLSGFEPLKTTVHNFRQYEDASIDWTDLSGRVAITGVNASGKSNIAKATIFGLYKRTPSSPGLDDELRRETSEGFVDVVFKAGGLRYNVRRVLERNSKGRVSCKSELFIMSEMLESDVRPVCENARDIDKKIAELVGGYDFVVSTFFASEAQIDALVQATPSEWRKHIISALSLETFEKFREISGRRARELSTRAGKNEAAAAELEELQGARHARLEELEDREVLAERRGLIEGEITGLETLRQEAIEKDAEDKAALAGIEEQLAEAQKTADKRLALEGNHKRAETALSALPALGEEPPEVEPLSLPDQRPARDVEVAKAKRESAGKAVDRMQLEGESLKRRIKDCEKTIERKEREYESIKKTQREKPKVPCQISLSEDALKCPAFISWTNGEAADALLGDIALAKDETRKLVDKLADIYTPLIEARDDFAAAELALQKAEGILEERGKQEREHLTAQKERNDWETAKYQREKAIDNLASAAAELKAAEKASGQIDALKKMKEAIDTTRLENKMASNKIEANISEKRNALRDIEMRIQTIESLISDIASLGERLEILRKDIRALRGEESGWVLLEKAFHSTGIPFLLLEEALPAIAEQTNRLLACTDLSVSINSVRENKDGAKKDDIEVRYLDPRGDFPLCVASGAQEKLLGIPLRFALAKVGGDFWGTPPRIFVQDEGFGAFHPDRYDQVRQIISRIAEEFGMFLYITHVTELTEDADIRFETQILGDNLSTLKRIV